MRRVDVYGITALCAILAVVTLFLVSTAGPPGLTFALGVILLFGVFLAASLCSNRYRHPDAQHDSEEFRGA
jgi:hypothetical protein